MQSLGDFEHLRSILSQFTEEPVEHVSPLGRGHIHQTYLARLSGGAQPLVLQRLNTQVFTDLEAVMQNIVRVTAHVRARLERERTGELDRRILTLYCTRAGKTHHVDPLLGSFRAFVYVADSMTLEHPETSTHVLEAGRVCGEFARLLDDLPPPLLHTPLPDFHATDRRFEALQAALTSDPMGRARQIDAEWRRVAQLEWLARECAQWACDPQLRRRITHNDTKLNNILFDVSSARGLCLVDLDTVMPGYLAYDFGDLVRTCLCTADEDACDVTQVDVRVEWLQPLMRGYLSELAPSLTPLERRSLARGPLWIVLELAMRFLTDFLLGDRYFKIARPSHNLDRARVQLALLSRLMELSPELQRAAEGAV